MITPGATLLLASAEETLDLGRRLGALLEPGDFVALTGELGAGKTHFVRGVAEGAKSADAVTSPSFTLVNVYRGGRLTLQHVDLYRLSGAAELFALGFDELLSEPAATLCEWADRAAGALPADRLTLRLEVLGATSRRATLEDSGGRSAALLRSLIS